MSDFERPNVVAIQGEGKVDQTAEMLRKLQAGLPNIIASQICLAQIAKAKFEALKAAGFTDAQALELCK